MVAFSIVSHVRKTRIRLFFLNIFVMAKVSTKITISGKPSDTATTIIVTVIIRISKNS
jgi:hypothetical protein